MTNPLEEGDMIHGLGAFILICACCILLIMTGESLWGGPRRGL